jgi:hypothetical protein
VTISFVELVGLYRGLGYESANHFTLKMAVAWSSETLVFYHITARCDNPKDRDFHLHRHENLKYHT